MVMFLHDLVGKTLLQVSRECGSSMKGYSVFVLQDDKDTTGKRLDEDISVGCILKNHPEYANAVVKFENDFYGTTVLRVMEKVGVDK